MTAPNVAETQVIIKPGGIIFVAILSAVIGIGIFGRNIFPPKVAQNSVANMTIPTTTIPPATHAVSTSVPADGILLQPDITGTEWTYMVDPAIAKGAVSSTVSSSVPNHPYAKKFTIHMLSGGPWGIQVARSLSVPFKAGKHIQLSYWGRSQTSSPVTAVVEQNKDPYTKIISQEANLTPNWQQYKVEWTQQSDVPADWAKADFYLGHKVGDIELTGVTIRQIEN